MRKIDSSQLVCSADQSAQLVALGIIPAACFCYEWIGDSPVGSSSTGEYEFAGEYLGQDHPLPAWTAEELMYLIGGDVGIVQLPTTQDWTENKNMLLLYVDIDMKLKQYPNAAKANADLLIFALQKGIVTAAQANERLEAFASGSFYNQINSKHFPKKKK